MRKEVFALEFNDTLWISGARQKIGGAFYPVITDGNYKVFKACIEDSKAMSIILPSAIGFGLIGGVIAGVIITPQRYLYVLSMRTGNVKRLNRYYIEQRLKDLNYSEILSQFEAEKDKKSNKILLHYSALINDEFKKQ